MPYVSTQHLQYHQPLIMCGPSLPHTLTLILAEQRSALETLDSEFLLIVFALIS